MGLLGAQAGFPRLCPWLKQPSALAVFYSNKPPLAGNGDSFVVPAVNMGPAFILWHNPCISYSLKAPTSIVFRRSPTGVPECVLSLEVNQPPTESAVGQSPTGKSVRCLTDVRHDCADNHNRTSCLGQNGSPYFSRETNRGDEKAGT